MSAKSERQEMTNSDMLFYSLKDKVPNDALLPLKESLDKADDGASERLLLVNFKNAVLGLVFSVILPGVDRIYRGDIALGVFKIIYFIGVYVALEASQLQTSQELGSDDYLGTLILLLVLAVGLLVWFVADMFLVWRGIKRDNLAKIFNALEAR